MKIAVLVYNTFENDARVEKAISTYASAGHEVLVLALAPVRQELKARPGVVQLRIWPGRSLFDRIAKATWLPLRRAAAAGSIWLRSGAKHGKLRSLYRFVRRIDGYQRFAVRAEETLRRSGFRPDFVHANDFNTLPAAELLLERLGVPFIYDSHELWSGRNRADPNVHPYEDRWELETERRIARKAAGVVTVSSSIAEHMARVFAVPAPAVIRNVPYASRSGRARGLRGLLGLGADAKLIVYTGRATFNRGLEEAIDALALLPPNVHLLVLGNYAPGFKAILDARIGEKGVRARVHNYGPVPSEQVPSWASEGDLSLVPIKGVCLSYEYCLPNKLFEGIQAGLPILATNLVEMKRTLEEYDCGLTYESGNVADLKAKIEHILGTPGLADRLRANAVKAARQLNWETEKARLLELLDAMPRAAAAPRASH